MLLPSDKVRIVEDLLARYGSVAVVGDGVNRRLRRRPLVSRWEQGHGRRARHSGRRAHGRRCGPHPLRDPTGRRALRIVKQNVIVAVSVTVLLVFADVLGRTSLPAGVVGQHAARHAQRAATAVAAALVVGSLRERRSTRLNWNSGSYAAIDLVQVAVALRMPADSAASVRPCDRVVSGQRVRAGRNDRRAAKREGSGLESRELRAAGSRAERVRVERRWFAQPRGNNGATSIQKLQVRVNVGSWPIRVTPRDLLLACSVSDLGANFSPTRRPNAREQHAAATGADRDDCP